MAIGNGKYMGLGIALGIAITFFGVLNVFAQKDFSDIDLAKETATAAALVSSGIKLRGEHIACGTNVTESGSKFSDGTYVHTSSTRFETSQAALEFFQKKMKNAVKVFQRKPEFLGKDKSIYSEEVLVMLKNNQPNDYTFVRLHLAGPGLDITTSNSLKHLLAYEMIGKIESERFQKLTNQP